MSTKDDKKENIQKIARNMLSSLDEIDKIKKALRLTDDDLNQMDDYVYKNRFLSIDESLLKVSQSDMKLNQIIFISYMKGIISEHIRQLDRESKKNKKKFNDAVEVFSDLSNGFEGWNTNEIFKVLISTLKTFTISIMKEDNKIAEVAMSISDDFAKFSEDFTKRAKNKNFRS